MFAVELTNFLMIAVSGETTVSVWRVFRRKKKHSLVTLSILICSWRIFRSFRFLPGNLRLCLDIFGSLWTSSVAFENLLKYLELPKTP